MTIDLIESFYTLVKYKSFTDAAEILCISQPTLSHRIKYLEDELGMKLIIRSRGNRPFELTQMGYDFIPIAEQWMALLKTTQTFQSDAKQRILSIGNIESFSYLFTNLYQDLIFPQNSERQFTFELYVLNSPSILQRLSDQDLDIGFITLPRDSRNLNIVPIFRERHYIVGNLATDKAIIDPRILDPHREVLTSWSADYMTWHNYYLGVKNCAIATVDSASMVASFLKEGVWCIVPACAVPYILDAGRKIYGNGVQAYDMATSPPDRICYKVTNQSPKSSRIEAIRYFERQLQRFLNEHELHL